MVCCERRTFHCRIVAYGASGGYIPSRKGVGVVTNYGAKVETIVNLTKEDQLDIVVGQQGMSPCTDWLQRSWKHNYTTKVCRPFRAWVHLQNLFVYCYMLQQGTMLRSLCDRQMEDLNEGDKFDMNMMPASSGGGASFVSLVLDRDWVERHQILIVAAGGGGLSFAGCDETAGGGFPPYNFSTVNAAATPGGGGGITHCSLDSEVSPAAQGKSLDQGSMGGSCLKKDFWRQHGGFGGGGAACGPGGGGGGGYRGSLHLFNFSPITRSLVSHVTVKPFDAASLIDTQ